MRKNKILDLYIQRGLNLLKRGGAVDFSDSEINRCTNDVVASVFYNNLLKHIRDCNEYKFIKSGSSEFPNYHFY